MWSQRSAIELSLYAKDNLRFLRPSPVPTLHKGGQPIVTLPKELANVIINSLAGTATITIDTHIEEGV